MVDEHKPGEWCSCRKCLGAEVARLRDTIVQRTERERDAALAGAEAADSRLLEALGREAALWQRVVEGDRRAEAAEKGLEQVLGPTREGETTLVHWIKTFKARAEAAEAALKATEERLETLLKEAEVAAGAAECPRHAQRVLLNAIAAARRKT